VGIWIRVYTYAVVESHANARIQPDTDARGRWWEIE
jgi:hypothetical protein